MNNETGFIEKLDNNTADKHTMIMFNSSADSGAGYGKPPKHTQFKKGKSGNPKGRPKKKYLVQALEDILNEHVTLIVNGEKKKMSKKEVTVQQLVNECMKGKHTAIRNLIYLLRSLTIMHPM